MGNSSKSHPNMLPHLRQLAVTLAQAQERNIPLEQLVELKYQEEKLGFYILNNLEEFCTQNQEIMPHIEIRNYSSNQHFHPLHLHPGLQRRNSSSLKQEEQLVGQIVSPNDQYLLLIKGKKSRPMTMEQIHSLLNNKEILFTNLVSPDNGVNWYKIFQLEGFDRRDETFSPDLPHQPEEELFENTAILLREKLQDHNENHNCQQAIINFAHLGLVQSGKTKSLLSDRTKEHEHKTVTNDDEQTEETNQDDQLIMNGNLNNGNHKIKFLKYVGIFTAIITIIFIFKTIFVSSQNKVGRVDNGAGKANKLYRLDESIKDKTKKIPNDDREFDLPSKETENSPSSTNLLRTKEFARKIIKKSKEKGKSNEDHNNIFHEVDDYSMDDFDTPIVDSSQIPSETERDTLPVEQDPVRSQLSKHLIDPTDGGLDEDLPYNPEEGGSPFPMDEIRENFKVNGSNNFLPEEYSPPEGEYLD